MWSDGSAQSNTNFAADSGLDGGHCCVKVEAVSGTNTSKWKGEKCSTILHGICEFRVSGTKACSCQSKVVYLKLGHDQTKPFCGLSSKTFY